MREINSAACEQANNSIARELKEVKVSVNSSLLKRAYNPAMLEMIACNNPGACSYENGVLTMNGLAYIIFSEGVNGAKNKIESIKKANNEKSVIEKEA